MRIPNKNKTNEKGAVEKDINVANEVNGKCSNMQMAEWWG